LTPTSIVLFDEGLTAEKAGKKLGVLKLECYDMQIRVPGLGFEGQKRLKNSKVVVVGVC